MRNILDALFLVRGTSWNGACAEGWRKKRKCLASALETLLTFNLVVPTVLTPSDLCSNPDHPTHQLCDLGRVICNLLSQPGCFGRGGVINDFTRAT